MKGGQYFTPINVDWEHVSQLKVKFIQPVWSIRYSMAKANTDSVELIKPGGPFVKLVFELIDLSRQLKSGSRLPNLSPRASGSASLFEVQFV